MSNSYRHRVYPPVSLAMRNVLRHLVLARRLFLFLVISLLLQPPVSPAQAQIGATRGTAVIAVSAFSPPFASQATNGQMVGFDLDLVKTLVRTAGLRVAYEAVPFSELIPGVATQLYDAAAGCIFVTEARKALVDFTISYFTTGTVLMFSNTNIQLYTLADLTPAMTVSASEGSTAERFLREQTPVQVIATAGQQAALELAVTGVADAALIDEMAAVRFLRNNPETHLTMMGGLVTTDECAFAVSKENPRLRLELNAALTRLKNNGKFLTMYRRWFGSRPLTGPRPTSRPTPIAMGTQSTIPAAVSTARMLATPASDNALGAYAITLTTDPLAYQLIELTPEGRWLESLIAPNADAFRGIQSLETGQFPVQTGHWQVGRTDSVALTVQISATVPFSVTIGSSVPLSDTGETVTSDKETVHSIQPRKEYQLTIRDDGSLYGAYTLYTSAVPTVTQILTETVEVVGQRIVQ